MIVGSRISADLPRILVSANEGPELIRFVAQLAKGKNLAIVSLYVQERPEASANYLKPSDRVPFRVRPNAAAQAAFDSTRTICTEAGVPVLQIHAVHNSRSEMLLDHAATWGVHAVVMGADRKNTKSANPRDPILHNVCTQLPKSIPLILHSSHNPD